jgi:hypothetical protein
MGNLIREPVIDFTYTEMMADIVKHYDHGNLKLPGDVTVADAAKATGLAPNTLLDRMKKGDVPEGMKLLKVYDESISHAVWILRKM